MIDFASTRPRDFAPERAQNANSTKRSSPMSPSCAAPRRKVVLASYSAGSRERLKGLLAEHGLDKVRRGRELAGGARRFGGRAGGAPARPRLHRAATSPLLTEQDMLGDRLVRRRKRRKSADAFLAELADAHAGRSRRPRRSRHRPLRRPDPDPGRRRRRTIASRSTMPAATSSTCRSRISTSCRATAARARAWRSTSSAARPGSGARRG